MVSPEKLRWTAVWLLRRMTDTNVQDLVPMNFRGRVFFAPKEKRAALQKGGISL